MFRDDGNGAAELLQENHYYGFGSEHYGEWNATISPLQKQLYNNKELTADFGLNWYFYGARMYDPLVGRFTGVDPISSQFPWVTTYNYAENSPIVNIDLHGLQAYSIHGLASTGKVWDRPGFKKVQKTLMKYTNNVIEWGREFSWKTSVLGRILTRAGSNGSRWQRKRAAKKLVSFIESTFESGAEITLIGVSDGGNVAIQTAKLLHEKYGIKVNIITVNTPGSVLPGHDENPNDNKGINDLIQISTEGDFVATSIGGGVQNPSHQPDSESLMIINEYSGSDDPAVHGTENVDTKQIENSNLNKLDVVPSRYRLTDEKRKKH